MSWESILCQLGLTNFAMVSMLSLQSSRQTSSSNKTLSYLAFTLFVIAVVSTFSAMVINALNLNFNPIASRGLIFASVTSILALIGHIFLRMKSIDLFAAPVAMGSLLLHVFLNPVNHEGVQSSWEGILLTFHIAGATMGQFLALAASIVAILYLWQQKVLKKKLLTQLTSRVPALDVMEKILILCLWIGFVFLTLALISGAYYFSRYYVAEGHYLLKIIWALAVWFWYLGTLLIKKIFRVSMKRVAQMSLLGFTLLALTFFGLVFFRTDAVALTQGIY